MPFNLKHTIATVGAFTMMASLAFGTLGMQQDPGLPSGHPQMETKPQMPAGHPENIPKEMTPNAAGANRPEAKAEDVKDIDSIVSAYYTSVSGAKRVARDWDRLLSLFMNDGRFVTARSSNGKVSPVIITPEDFVSANRTYFERGGYFEEEIHRTTNSYGNVAQVFSTYASRHAEADPQPYSRGINSIQLMKAGGRWWIVSIMWDFENGLVDHVIPAEYLPEIEIAEKK